MLRSSVFEARPESLLGALLSTSPFDRGPPYTTLCHLTTLLSHISPLDQEKSSECNKKDVVVVHLDSRGAGDGRVGPEQGCPDQAGEAQWSLISWVLIDEADPPEISSPEWDEGDGGGMASLRWPPGRLDR